jgi:hypothetical protein
MPGFVHARRPRSRTRYGAIPQKQLSERVGSSVSAVVPTMKLWQRDWKHRNCGLVPNNPV